MAQMTTTCFIARISSSPFLERVERDVVHTGNLPVGHLIDLRAIVEHVRAFVGVEEWEELVGGDTGINPRRATRKSTSRFAGTAPSRNEGLVMTEARNVNVGEVLDILDGGAFLLDVREDNEWESGRASNATHIPLNDVPDLEKCRVIA